MSKVNQIQSALIEIDQARFQKLCDAHLRRLGYDNINPLGSVIGKDKVRVGTPDTFVPLPSGRYLFAEYTTKQEGVCKKFQDDLAKCFDVGKTGVPLEEIERIILYYNTQLDLEEDRVLRKICAEHGCAVDIYSIGKLSHDLAERYPEIAKDYLSIDVDTGQIVEEERFISSYQKSPIATKIDTAFIGREGNLASALGKLDEHNVLLISGRPGVGKTRLAIEYCRKFVGIHHEFKVRFVKNLGPDLFSDLRLNFTPPGHYLIVVDDANRLPGFEYVLSLLQEANPDRQIKIICTVRDYALDKVQKIAKEYAIPAEIKINAFSDEEIKNLVSAEYSIGDAVCLERIARLSEGNPRIAMMAASIADEHQTLESINDVTGLYDRYFESITNEVNEANEPDLWRVAGVITLFRNVDRSDKEQMEIIESVCGISPDSFWQHAYRLHDLEIVDMYEDHTLVRIADQVLATYLFYRAAFREGLLNLSPIFLQLFPRFRHRLIDAINPVVSAFDRDQIKKVLKPSVITAWNQFEQEEKWEEWWDLLETFWWIDETKTLKSMRDAVHETDPELMAVDDIDWRPNGAIPHKNPLRVLQHFWQSNDRDSAIGLILEYAARQPKIYNCAVHVLTYDYGFRPNSYEYAYTRERLVIEMIWRRWEELREAASARLFIAVVSDFVKIDRAYLVGKPLRLARFSLAAMDGLRILRSVMFKRLFELYELRDVKREIVDVIKKYPWPKCSTDSVDIVAWDMEVLFDFFNEYLDPAQYGDCVIVREALKHCRSCGIQYDILIERRFSTVEYELSIFLHGDSGDSLENGCQKAQDAKADDIRERFKMYSFDDYREFLLRCKCIVDGAENDYKAKRRIESVMEFLCRQDRKVFVMVMEDYLADGDQLRLNSHVLIDAMIKMLGSEETLDIIQYAVGEVGYVWRSSFYHAISVNKIQKDYLDDIVEIYRSADSHHIPYGFLYLVSYSRFDPSFPNRIASILLERAISDVRFLESFMDLFLFADVGESSLMLIVEFDVAKRIYIAVAEYDSKVDCKSFLLGLIVDRDAGFLREYMRSRASKNRYGWYESRDYEFMWRRGDYRDIVKVALDDVFAIGQEFDFSPDSMRDAILKIDPDSEGDQVSLLKKRTDLLKEVVNERSTDKDYMAFLFDGIMRLDDELCRQILGCFLQKNKVLNDFRNIFTCPSSWPVMGSGVPAYSKAKELVESLLPLTSGLDFLDHREYLEQVIESCDRSIESEKKSDFLRD